MGLHLLKLVFLLALNPQATNKNIIKPFEISLLTHLRCSTRGLSSVKIVNCLSYFYLWDFLTQNTMAIPSFSSCAWHCSAFKKLLEVKVMSLSCFHYLMRQHNPYATWWCIRGKDQRLWQIIMYERCPWCNDYRHRKWTRRHKFKSWMRLITFPIALIPLGKVWIQLFSLQLWVNSRAD